MTNSIRFYWNGIRLNGEKSLVKCFYSLSNSKNDNESVTIYARDGYSLPRDLFEVKNETDLYTDYFDTDSAILTPDHPLYKYARYAAVKAEIRGLKSHIDYEKKRIESNPRYAKMYNLEEYLNQRIEQLSSLESEKDPGQPTEEDLDKIAQARMEAENARKAAEHEEKLKAREKMIACKNAGRIFIEETARKYPIREGEPVVTINWSENPAFYSWEDNELKLSVAAAEIVLKHYDEEVHADEDRGYDKTSFTIEFVNEDGEQDTYEGRYDLGDNDGGMIEHIRAFGRFYVEKGHFGNGNVSEEDRETGEAIMKFADMLESYTAGGKIVSVALAPWVEKAIKDKQQENMKDMAMVMYLVQQMSNEDLEAAIMSIDPSDREKELVAKFFIQQLGRRDIKRAIEVYQEWKKQ